MVFALWERRMRMLRDHYIFSNGRLKRKNNTVYFEEAEGAKKTIPIEKIRTIHLFGEIDINTKLIVFLNHHGVMLQFYNYYSFFGGHFAPREKKEAGVVIVKQSEHYLSKENRMFLAFQFLNSGVHHILRNLRSYQPATLPYIKDIEKLREQLRQTNSITAIMGLEGNIRQLYYQSFKVIFKQDFVIERREKRPPRDPVNALLSFGNTLAYSAILSEIYKTPLNPTISYLHEPSTKRFSLSLDLAEIFKPLIVDPIIFSLINKKQITKKHFDYLEKEICYLNEEGKKKFILAWEDRLKKTIKHRTLKRKVSYRYLIRLECYKLVKHVISDEKYKPLKAWW